MLVSLSPLEQPRWTGRNVDRCQTKKNLSQGRNSPRSDVSHSVVFIEHSLTDTQFCILVEAPGTLAERTKCKFSLNPRRTGFVGGCLHCHLHWAGGGILCKLVSSFQRIRGNIFFTLYQMRIVNNPKVKVSRGKTWSPQFFSNAVFVTAVLTI